MADIIGTEGDDNLNGNAAGEDDFIQGGRGDDNLTGQSGDDYLGGGRGDDVLVGGSGSDVIAGGLDGDSFQVSAGHITTGTIDWVLDFAFNQNDQLDFRNSSSGDIEIVSATAAFVTNQSFNGYDLNNSAPAKELILEIRNTGTGQVQQFVLMDVYNTNTASLWAAALAAEGFTGTVTDNGDTLTL